MKKKASGGRGVTVKQTLFVLLVVCLSFPRHGVEQPSSSSLLLLAAEEHRKQPTTTLVTATMGSLNVRTCVVLE